MEIKRHHHWEQKLHDYVNSNVTTPFTWGTLDCGLFAAGGIQAMTDTDIATEFRGKYTTQLGAARLAKRLAGGPTVEHIAACVTEQNQMKELLNVKLAHRGDLVLFDGAEGPALGLVYLDGMNAIFVGEGGLRRVPVKDTRRAWRVGY